MAYWHMQLHPNDTEWEREKELLEKRALIGCGLLNDAQTNLFISELKIDDIVLIKRGKIPVALTKVVGDLEDAEKNNLNNLDWFRYRRKVKVLGWAKGSNQSEFPSPRGTITKAIDKKSKSYKYIDNWYAKTDAGIKLRHIFIENHKMFKNFNISLINENKSSPIIVIAGINGSGKTSLLEYIKYFVQSLNEKGASFIKFKDLKEDTIETLNSAYTKLGDKPIAELFQENVMYVPLLQEFDHVKKEIVKYQQDIMYKKDIKPSETYQIIVDNIHQFLGELNLDAEFDSLDENEQIYFRNNSGKHFSIDKLSSGQKTVLSKMLNFFLSDVKGKVILIDEPELSLHPSWQNKILKVYENFAKTNNCQIIIATHSPHIIGSAKNEYLRVLTFNDDNNVEVISGGTSYGRDINWVLEEVMGTEYTREKLILDKIRKIEKLIDDEQYIEAEKYIDVLESVIGGNDNELVRLRTVLEFEKD